MGGTSRSCSLPCIVGSRRATDSPKRTPQGQLPTFKVRLVFQRFAFSEGCRPEYTGRSSINICETIGKAHDGYSLPGHLAARLGATTASLGAALTMLCVVRIALFFTPVTDVRTELANLLGERTVAGHRISA